MEVVRDDNDDDRSIDNIKEAALFVPATVHRIQSGDQKMSLCLYVWRLLSLPVSGLPMAEPESAGGENPL